MENLANESDLLQQLAQGDESAFQQLFSHYWNQVYGAALRLTKSPEQATDLAQDIFLKVWLNRAKMQEIRNFPAFLNTVSRNLIHDHIRTKLFREHDKAFIYSYLSYNETTPQRLLENKELTRLLQEAINSLPPQLKQVFTMGRLKGFRHEEIARQLNITPLSSKVYMVRALTALRKYLEQHADKLLLLLILFPFYIKNKNF